MSLLRAQEIRHAFASGGLVTPVLHGVTLELPAGHLTLLMGPSGSGKTTLVSILAGLLPPSGGRVELCGVAITGLPQPAVTEVRRNGVGFVFQSDNLFPALTALQNVAEVLCMRGTPRPRALQLASATLQRVGLGERMHHKPHQLSGGQRQRVAIARAIADAPALVIGDEVTSALDWTSAELVMQLLRSHVCERQSVLLVTHDRRLMRFADRVVELEDGRIVSDGPGEFRAARADGAMPALQGGAW